MTTASDRFAPFVDGVDFGEGPRWHEGRLWYSDFFQQRVYAVDPAGNRETMIEFPGRPSGMGWMPDGTLLIVSMIDRSVMRYDETKPEGERLSLHADLSHIATDKCNDMVVDAAGNAYVGNFGWDIETEGFGNITPANLALVRPDGSSEIAASGLLFPNGAVITPDGSTLIVGETAGAAYKAYDIADDATLSDERVWAAVPNTAPDGCDLDAEGGIWFADAMNGRVVRVVEGGEITDTIDTGMGCFACRLGGEDGRTLYALCAPSAEPDKAAGSGAGAILQTQVDVAAAG